MGFEPTRAEHIGLAVQRLNHSATSSSNFCCLDLTVVMVAYEKCKNKSKSGNFHNEESSHAGN